jgi:hypothetical protein
MALTIFTVTPTSTPGASSTPTTKTSAAKAPAPAPGAVIVSLSAAAWQIGLPSAQSGPGSDLVAQWRESLGDRDKADRSALAQLQALNKQMRSSRHDDASLRLQQLLEQYRTLRMLGGNPKALAELAKQIKAATNELSASSGDAASADPSADAAAGGATAAAAPTDATGETTAAVTVESAASGAVSIDTSNAGDVASTLPASDAAVATATSGDHGDGTDPSTSGEATASNPPPGRQADAVWQQLIQQVNDAGARAHRKANDEMLLAQARAALADLERMAKQAEAAKPTSRPRIAREIPAAAVSTRLSSSVSGTRPRLSSFLHGTFAYEARGPSAAARPSFAQEPGAPDHVTHSHCRRRRPSRSRARGVRAGAEQRAVDRRQGQALVPEAVERRQGGMGQGQGQVGHVQPARHPAAPQRTQELVVHLRLHEVVTDVRLSTHDSDLAKR